MCLDDVFESAYLPYTSTSVIPAWEEFPSVYGSCPLQRRFNEWYSRSYTRDAANWNAYARVMKELECPECIAPVIAQPGKPVHPFLVPEPEAWWAQTPWIALPRDKLYGEILEERSALYWEYDGKEAVTLWGLAKDNELLAALSACKAEACVPSTSDSLLKASMSVFASCLQENVWQPFKQQCVNSSAPCAVRIHELGSSACLLDASLLQHRRPSWQGGASFVDESVLRIAFIVISIVAVVAALIKRLMCAASGMPATKPGKAA
jgi:hypothetical protein